MEQKSGKIKFQKGWVYDDVRLFQIVHHWDPVDREKIRSFMNFIDNYELNYQDR